MDWSAYLTPLLIPLNLALLFLALGLVLLLLRWRKLALTLSLLGAAWVLLWSLPATTLALGGRLEHRYPQPDIARLPVVDGIVVLGGNIANGRANWFEAYDADSAHLRVDTAQALYDAGRATRIILSGAALDGPTSEAQMMANILASRGIPAAHLILETHSLTTHENAVYTQATLAGHGMQQVILVTSALHMPRAMAVFRKQGIRAIPAPAPLQIRRPTQAAFSTWRPDWRTLTASRSIIKEYAGLLVYWLRGWV